MTDAATPATTTKPGFKSTEFYLIILANIVGLLMMSGVFGPTSGIEKALEFAAQALANAGYAYGRSLVKAA